MRLVLSRVLKYPTLTAFDRRSPQNWAGHLFFATQVFTPRRPNRRERRCTWRCSAETFLWGGGGGIYVDHGKRMTTRQNKHRRGLGSETKPEHGKPETTMANKKQTNCHTTIISRIQPKPQQNAPKSTLNQAQTTAQTQPGCFP